MIIILILVLQAHDYSHCGVLWCGQNTWIATSPVSYGLGADTVPIDSTKIEVQLSQIALLD